MPHQTTKTCQQCGATFRKPRNRSIASFATAKYCSCSCAASARWGLPHNRPPEPTVPPDSLRLKTRPYGSGRNGTCHHCGWFDARTPVLTNAGQRQRWCPHCIRHSSHNIRAILPA